MRRLALLFVIVLVGTVTLTIGGGDAQAQNLQPPNESQGHLGLFALNPGLVFSTGYDTNPYRDDKSEPDVETYVIPQIDSWFTPGRFTANLYGAVELVRFQNRNGARNHQYGIRTELNGGDRILPFFNFNSKHTNANPTGFEVGRKSMRNENALKTGLRARIGGQVTAGAFITRSVTDWDADAIYQTSSLKEKLNRTDTSLGFGIDIPLTPLTSVRFGGETNGNDFLFSPARNGTGYRFGPGLTFVGPAAVVGNVDIGWKSFTSASSDVKFRGLVSSTALTRSFPGGTFVGFRLDRDMQFSYDLSLAYFVSTSTEFNVIQPLGDAFGVQGFWAHHGLSYNEAPPGAVPLNAVTEYGLAFARRVGTTMRVGSSLEWANAKGNQPWDEFRVVAFITFGTGSFQRLDRPIPFQR
jgi:hypothetical protein